MMIFHCRHSEKTGSKNSHLCRRGSRSIISFVFFRTLHLMHDKFQPRKTSGDDQPIFFWTILHYQTPGCINRMELRCFPPPAICHEEPADCQNPQRNFDPQAIPGICIPLWLMPFCQGSSWTYPHPTLLYIGGIIILNFESTTASLSPLLNTQIADRFKLLTCQLKLTQYRHDRRFPVVR